MALAAGTNTIDGPHGSLHVHVWPGEGTPLIAVHGVDGSHRSWSPVAEALGGERPLIAPDLRGRGRSSMSGPFGVAAHADDIAVVIEAALGEFPAADGVVVLAHSFGCHVAARVAVSHPRLVESLLLVDGGPPRVIPERMTAEEVVAGALANILPHLDAKPHDVSAEAVKDDFTSMVLDPVGSMSLQAVTVPVHLVRAELGVAPGLPPVVPDSVVADLVRAGVDLTHETVAEAGHFSILGAGQLLAAVRRS
jgi:pimeloyl-ACP methyl ester carboxylesterase